MPKHVQLNNIEHAKLRVRTERSAELGDNVMFSPTFPHEFRNVQAHYPIVFIKEEKENRFRPIALFGMEKDENLFLENDKWDAPYLPIVNRMQPFLIGVKPGPEREMEVHVDIEHPRMSETEGTPLFLDHGGHSDMLKEIVGILGDVHEGEASINGFSAALTDLGLLEPFTLDVTLNDNSKNRLAGFYTISEEKLQTLSAAHLDGLHKSGFLMPIFMAVASIAQFRGLIDRRNSRLTKA